MASQHEVGRQHRKILATYQYTDEAGNPAFEIVRFEPKDFRVRYKDENGNLCWRKPPKIFPYRLHELLLSTPNEIVFLVEGEKDVETLRKFRLLATTNPFGQGPGKFQKAWAPYFQGRHCMLIPDRDEVGRKHMEGIAEILRPVAASLATLELPLADGQKDVTDWFSDTGNTFNRFLELAVSCQDQHIKKPIRQIYEEYAETERGDAWEGPARVPAVAQAREEEEEEAKTPFQAFPLECLPVIVRDYVYHGSQALHCDPTYLALPALCTLGGLIGNTRVIQLKETWVEPCVFWGVNIAESSTLKSPALDCAIGPAMTIQDELFLDYERAMEGYKVAMEEWKSSGGKAEGNKRYASKSPPVQPDARRIIVNDITIEKLAQILHKNPRGLILKRDELSGWFGSFGQYKGSSGSSDLPIWLEIHRASPLTIDRKGGDIPTMHIPHSAVTVIGTIQPAIFSRVITSAFFDSGLTSRLLLAMPPKRKKVWTEDVIPHLVGESYRKLLKDIWREINLEQDRNSVWPRVITLTADGKAAWVNFYTRHADLQHESEGERSYALAKLEGYCARFALLFAVVEYYSRQADCQEVTAQHIQKAEMLINWFANEADRVYSSIRNPEEVMQEERLKEFIASLGGEITPRRLLRSNQSKYKSAKICRGLLDSLVSRNFGKWEFRRDKAANGGPAAETFVLFDF